jgi:3-oxoacyl-(acyl-carrier-protein) synthase
MAARIAVTGIGMLTPIGCTALQVLENLRLGRSGIRPIQSFDAGSFVTQYAGEVIEFVVDDYFSPREQMELDRGTQMGIVAAQQAWDSAGIPQVDPERVGLVVGMTGAGQYQNAHFSRSRKMVELPEVSFFHIRNLSHFQTTVIARRLHIQGPSLTFTCASAGSTYAIGHGMSLLSSGRADIVVAGGVEAMSRVPMGSSLAGANPFTEQIMTRYNMIPQGVAADEQAGQHAMDDFRMADDHLVDFVENPAVRLAERVGPLLHGRIVHGGPWSVVRSQLSDFATDN